MSKVIKCKTCGADIATSAKSCPNCGAKNKKPLYTDWWVWSIAVIFVINILYGISEIKINKEAVNPVTSKAASSSDISTDKKPAEETVPDVPTEYKSALKKAETYGKTMNLSKLRIYDQLTSEYGEKFTPEAAQYAIDNVQIDWNQNALIKAKIYQETMDMSPARIKDQLTSVNGERFTEEEADYAIDNLE